MTTLTERGASLSGDDLRRYARMSGFLYDDSRLEELASLIEERLRELVAIWDVELGMSSMLVEGEGGSWDERL
jgi:hypothetical protein